MRARIRPSKPNSFLALLIGSAFTILGIFFILPQGGWFGILWTGVAAVITAYHAVNLFREGGIADEVVDFETGGALEGEPANVETRLKRLEELKGRGLINEAEYNEQRSRILKEI